MKIIQQQNRRNFNSLANTEASVSFLYRWGNVDFFSLTKLRQRESVKKNFLSYFILTIISIVSLRIRTKPLKPLPLCFKRLTTITRLLKLQLQLEFLSKPTRALLAAAVVVNLKQRPTPILSIQINLFHLAK